MRLAAAEGGEPGHALHVYRPLCCAWTHLQLARVLRLRRLVGWVKASLLLGLAFQPVAACWVLLQRLRLLLVAWLAEASQPEWLMRRCGAAAAAAAAHENALQHACLQEWLPANPWRRLTAAAPGAEPGLAAAGGEAGCAVSGRPLLLAVRGH